ncbi:hypothetical protein ACLOJK_013925 [Asimina triloba]
MDVLSVRGSLSIDDCLSIWTAGDLIFDLLLQKHVAASKRKTTEKNGLGPSNSRPRIRAAADLFI